MERGWDPEVKRYFRKILHSIAYGLIWMMTMATLGLYHGFAYRDGRPLIYPVGFYIILIASFIWLMSYYYRTWKK